MADAGEPKKREYRISPPVMRAIVLLTDGTTRTLTETAARVGMTREGLSKALQRSSVQEALRKRIVSVLGAGAAAASARLIELLGAENSMTAFNSSKLLLGLSGFQPPNNRGPVVSIMGNNVGFVLDLREAGEALSEHDQAVLAGVAERRAAGAVLGVGPRVPKMTPAQTARSPYHQPSSQSQSEQILFKYAAPFTSSESTGPIEFRRQVCRLISASPI